MIFSPAQLRFEKQKQAYCNGDISTVKRIAEEARNELIKKGYVSAWPVYKWIEKEWFAKAIQEDVISFHSDANGYQIVGYKKDEEVTVGYRGRTPIIVKKKILDISKFRDFDKRYKEFREKKEKQQFAINNEIQNIVETEGK